MKKSLGLLLLCTALLFAQEAMPKAQEKAETAELTAAKQSAAEAKAEIEAAQKKLADAEKIIKKNSADLPAKDGGEAVYSTKTELSYSNTQGNTNTEQFALNFHGERKRKKTTLKLDIDVLTSSAEGEENNNKWLAVAQYDREMSKAAYFNYVIAYGEDKFSGFDYQFNTGPGLGYKVIDSDAHKLDLRTNALYSEDKLDNGDKNEYASWLAGFNYKWQILDNLSFNEVAYYKVEVDQSQNYFMFSKTGIESIINSVFSLGLTYKVDYKNRPSEGKKRLDRTFLASLIINY